MDKVRKPTEEYVSVEEAARSLVSSKREVKRLCASGKLRDAVLENNRWIIPRSSVEFLAWEN